MALEIVPSGLSDLVATDVLANEFLFLLADRDGSILTHPALLHATGSSPSSTVVSVPHVGLGGYDLLTATTPGSSVANVALTDGSTDVTIAMRGKAYTLDDLARYIVNGKLEPSMFAQDAAISVAQTLISLIANVADDFTTVVGSSGVDATWNDIVDAATALGIAKASGDMLGVLHPRQWGDLQIDALSLGMVAAQTMGGVINTGLRGAYKGRWMDIDFYTSSYVPTANAAADYAGAIFTRGGIAWADAQMHPTASANTVVDMGRARLEVYRGDALADKFIVSYACGVAKAINGAGVTLTTDA